MSESNQRNRKRKPARGSKVESSDPEVLRVIAAAEPDPNQAARLRLIATADRLHELHARFTWFLHVGVKHANNVAFGFVLYAKRKPTNMELMLVASTWEGLPVTVMVSGAPKPARTH